MICPPEFWVLGDILELLQYDEFHDLSNRLFVEQLDGTYTPNGANINDLLEGWVSSVVGKDLFLFDGASTLVRLSPTFFDMDLTSVLGLSKDLPKGFSSEERLRFRTNFGFGFELSKNIQDLLKASPQLREAAKEPIIYSTCGDDIVEIFSNDVTEAGVGLTTYFSEIEPPIFSDSGVLENEDSLFS